MRKKTVQTSSTKGNAKSNTKSNARKSVKSSVKSSAKNSSTRRCRSQAPFCLCTLRMVSIHSEGTFGRLRYALGGDRPSQTAHLALSVTGITA